VLIRTLITATALAVATSGAFAQAQKAQEFTPQVGQAGKDVIWVPTPEALVDRMLAMAKVTANDIVYDLGSGDGRTVIKAAKLGATATGIEYNPDMVTLSQKNAQAQGVTGKATFMKADLFETDLSKATVITMYLLPDINLRLRPKILDLRPGTRVVSHAFTMGDWEPDERAEVEGRSAMLWIVPAKVGGNWTVKGPGGSYDVQLTQTYQKLTGTARTGSGGGPIEDGKVNGENVTFTIVDGGKRQRFVGKVAGGVINGALDAGSTAQTGWTATRK
jgi:SAM-dependent methyltransferase